MRCIDEAKKINQLFKESFGYQTSLFAIPSKRAEEALKCEIKEFLERHDESGSLLIVYYGGHGDSDGDHGRRGAVWAAYVSHLLEH